MHSRTHPVRLLFRRPYKLLLCCLVNLIVILFTVIEGVQMTETRAAMEAAIGSRFYTGTLTRVVEYQSDAGMRTYYDSSYPISQDAVDVLESSPYVGAIQSCELRTARFGDGKKYVKGAAANYCMVVGVSGTEIFGANDHGVQNQRFTLRPTYLAAGDPDTFKIGYGEGVILPAVVFSHPDVPYEVHRDERFFLFGETPHSPKNTCNSIRIYNPPEEEAMYYPQHTLIVGEEPGDELLSDEDFATKVMREYDLEKIAERLNDVIDMTAVLEIPTVDMFLPWRNNLMRIVSGRPLTEADAGKKVCMVPSEMLVSLRKKVGDTVILAVSDHDLSGGWNGLPGIFSDYDPEDFGRPEEYEVVGTYANDSGMDLDSNTAGFFLHEILIPRPEDRSYEPVSMYHFSFSVHKDDYESYLFETEPLLTEMGYTVIMSRPEYADVEQQLEDLRSRSSSAFLTSGIALAVGLAVAAGSLVLFWRNDYLTERRLGARKREAMGLYVRAFGIIAAFSLVFSALAVFLTGRTGLVASFAPENLSPRLWTAMAVFAGAELLLCALVALCSALLMDRRKIGG